MAHEYLQACQALGPRLRDSQVFGFEMWAKEYRGDLGIALSDVYGIEPFLKDFDMYFCKLFDGARHDSGDPFVWGERMIAKVSFSVTASRFRGSSSFTGDFTAASASVSVSAPIS